MASPSRDPEAAAVALHPPLPAATRALLRTAVRELARTERREVFPPQLHVGTPGGAALSTPILDAPADFGTRVDLVHAMVRRIGSDAPGTPDSVPWVWLTRSGPATPGGLDLAVLAASIHAYAEVGEPLTYVVVTRRSWHDPRSGLQQSWSRIRAA